MAYKSYKYLAISESISKSMARRDVPLWEGIFSLTCELSSEHEYSSDFSDSNGAILNICAFIHPWEYISSSLYNYLQCIRSVQVNWKTGWIIDFKTSTEYVGGSSVIYINQSV